jgi:dipeptidyl aminopeptidase/acylaminoacyl peptidase
MEPSGSGPLLVYEAVGDSVEVVVYDIGSRRDLWRFQPSGPYALAPGRAAIIEVSASPGLELRERRLSGAADTVLRFSSQQRVTGVAISPDGTKVAFGTTDGNSFRTDESIQLLDINAGEVTELARFEYAPGTLDIIGRPEPVVWRADGSGIVFRYYSGHGPAALLGTLSTSGNLISHGVFASLISPDGRYAVNDDVNTVGCIPDSPQRLRLIDLLTGGDTVVVEDPARGIRDERWSPNGDELMYDTYDTVDLGPGACLPGLAQASRKTYLVSPSDPVPAEVDATTVRKRWYAGHDVSVTCATSPEEWGGCAGQVALTIDGSPVATSREIRIIGVVPR